MINGGEGFHGAHHETPWCANHGRRHWYNMDLSYVVILLFERLGLVWNVQHPNQPDTRRRHVEPQSVMLMTAETSDDVADSGSSYLDYEKHRRSNALSHRMRAAESLLI